MLISLTNTALQATTASIMDLCDNKYEDKFQFCDKGPAKKEKLVVMPSASAHILTMSPEEEAHRPQSVAFDSHRRLDLSEQCKEAKLVIIGLQETRMNRSRARPIGPYRVFVAAVGKRGQGGIE